MIAEQSNETQARSSLVSRITFPPSSSCGLPELGSTTLSQQTREMLRTKKLLVGGLAIAAMLVLAGDLAQADKPVKPSPEPERPVQYQIRFFEVVFQTGVSVDASHVNAMNNFGQIVGYCYNLDGEMRAFLYDPATDDHSEATGQAIDLNTVVDPDMLLIDEVQWVIASAVDINDAGDIVGTLKQKGVVGYGGDRRGFVIDMNATNENGDPQPRLHHIPDGTLGTNTSAMRINNNGDILGRYLAEDVYGWYLYNPGFYPLAVPYDLVDFGIAYYGYLLSDVLFDSNGDPLLDGNGNPVGPVIVGTDENGVWRLLVERSADGTPRTDNTCPSQKPHPGQTSMPR